MPHPDNPTAPDARVTIHTLRLRLSNVHLAVGKGCVLFDAGSPNESGRILDWIAGLGLPHPKAIILTHAHADHAGAAVQLRKITKAPICLASPDWPVAQIGRNGPLQVTRRSAWPLKYLVPQRFPAFIPDHALDRPDALAAFGLAARVLHTPGHTPGSVSALFPDGQAIVGDLLMGGYIGGNLLPHRPRPHYFAEDPVQNARSLADVLALGARRLHVGHGGPIEVSQMKEHAA
jgi:glyoxylase-like metal-dependent hydrolase (beta-lactamase superfamily II)